MSVYLHQNYNMFFFLFWMVFGVNVVVTAIDRRSPEPDPSLSRHRVTIGGIKGCRMGRSDKVSLWYVSLLINTSFRFFILE